MTCDGGHIGSRCLVQPVYLIAHGHVRTSEAHHGLMILFCLWEHTHLANQQAGVLLQSPAPTIMMSRPTNLLQETTTWRQCKRHIGF